MTASPCFSLLQRLFLVCLLALLPLNAAYAVALPGVLGGGTKTQPQAQEPLGQSLDEVIKSLENDQQRAQLPTDLKKLRDATKKAQPGSDQGVLGLIGSSLGELEKKFSGADSPLTRWSEEIDLAQDEFVALLLPANQWLPVIVGFALVLLLWSLLAAALM